MKHLISASAIQRLQEVHHQHQFNDNAIRLTRTLGTRVGLNRIGIHLVRLQPGRDSTQQHYHDADEEFIYILSGRGLAHIGNERHEVGPGDFMGFPAPSPAHGLENPFDEDLVYLMGGERNVVDAVHYPLIRRTMLKSYGRRQWVDWHDMRNLPEREDFGA
jgi:uncharacterized cupin superfamily protein